MSRNRRKKVGHFGFAVRAQKDEMGMSADIDEAMSAVVPSVNSLKFSFRERG
jgi:hypothetical protein